jgi:hypothetical protein
LVFVAAAPAAGAGGLATPQKKEHAMRLVSSAENSSLNWRAQYRYIQDIHDGRGYTAGIIGFCSGTGDMLEVVRAFTRAFLDERVVEMHKEAAHDDVSRIETAQRRFLREGNLDLDAPLRWAVYGDDYSILP